MRRGGTAVGGRFRKGDTVRVLVVEDARSLAEVVAEGLRDQGMAVDIAHDGLAAAAKLDLNTYDVVLLDRDLPGIHGDTLCQMITERDDRAMVLMLTAAGAPGDRVSGLTLGADDYLAKPFHFPELILRIRSLARRRPDARARTLRTMRPRTRPGTPNRPPRRPSAGAVRQGVRRPGGAAACRPGLPEHREPPGTGVGRERRPVHQHGDRHHRPVAPQAGHPAGHHDDARGGLSRRRYSDRLTQFP